MATKNYENDFRKRIQKREREQQLSDSEYLSIDMEMNVILSACLSYKHETVFRPLPKLFFPSSSSSSEEENQTREHAKFVKTLVSLPSVRNWFNKTDELTDDQARLVHWIIFEKKFKIKMTKCESPGGGVVEIQKHIKKTANCQAEFAQCLHVFELEYDAEKELKFKQRLREREEASENANSNKNSSLRLCFHGTRMENVFSIVSSGLLTHLSKNALFGEGTYLSSEASVSLLYASASSQITDDWPHSSIRSDNLSCLFACETITHPDYVKSGSTTTANSKSSNSSIPEEYFIVKNNDFVRVKYLLVYSDGNKRANHHRKASARKVRALSSSSRLLEYVRENRFSFMMLAYGGMLGFVGLLSSNSFGNSMRQWRIRFNQLFPID